MDPKAMGPQRGAAAGGVATGAPPEEPAPTTEVWLDATGDRPAAAVVMHLTGLRQPSSNDVRVVVESVVGTPSPEGDPLPRRGDVPALLADAYPELVDAGLEQQLGEVLRDRRTRHVLAHRGTRTWSVELAPGEGGALAIWSEVSELLERRRAAGVDQAWVQRLLERPGDLIVVVAADGTIAYASPASVELLRMTPEQLQGVALESLVHPEDVDAFRAAVERGEACLARLRRADGRWRWTHQLCAPDEGAGGVAGVLVTARDADRLVAAVPDGVELSQLVEALLDGATAPMVAVVVADEVRDERDVVVDYTCELVEATPTFEARLPLPGEQLSTAFPLVARNGLLRELAARPRGGSLPRVPHARLSGGPGADLYEVTVLALGTRVLLGWRDRGGRQVVDLRSPEGIVLSPRERDILALLAEGASTVTIAQTLYLSTNTVRNHIRRLLGHLGASSRLEAVVIASRLGMLELRRPVEP